MKCPFCDIPCNRDWCPFTEEKELTVNYDNGEIVKEIDWKKAVEFSESDKAKENSVSDKKQDKDHVSPTGSLRRNNGKPEISQLDPDFILDLADLMTVSAKKYGKFNWALGQFFCTVLDSMGRHFFKLLRGEDIDEESGKHHVLHIAANCMIIYRSFKKDKQLLDDRHNWR
jgi:hypothetical protein